MREVRMRQTSKLISPQFDDDNRYLTDSFPLDPSEAN